MSAALRYLTIVFFSAIASACASTSESGSSPDRTHHSNGNDETNPNGAHQSFIDDLTFPRPSAVSEHGLSGLYTRVVVSAVNDPEHEPFIPLRFRDDYRDANDSEDPRGFNRNSENINEPSYSSSRDYRRETRYWFQRWFLGRVNTKTALLHVEISSPNIRTTSTIVSFTHESTRTSGEQFSTEIRHNSVATPFFRIEPDATFDLRVEMDMGYTTSSDTIAATLSTASTALSILGPSSQLLTSLNRQEVNQATQFFDNTVSAVLSEDLTEIIHVKNGIEDWLLGQRAEFTILTPDHSARRIAEINGRHTHSVGSWRVELDLPRISIWSEFSPCWRLQDEMVCPDSFPFNDVSLQHRAEELGHTLQYLTQAQVLQFKVTDTTTLGAHIRDQAWYTRAISDINSLPEDENERSARTASFCRQVMRTAVETGFNALDSHIVLWAVLGSAEVSPNARGIAFDTGCTREKELIDSLELRI